MSGLGTDHLRQEFKWSLHWEQFHNCRGSWSWMFPIALDKREAMQPSLSPPEPQLSEEPQQPGMKVSDTTKTKTVSRRTAQSCAGCHAGTKTDEYLSIPLSPLEVAALTFRVDQLFLCHQRQGRGMETDTVLGKLGSTSSRHATAQQLRTFSNKSLAKRCYYSLPSPGITPEPTVIPGG